MRGKIEKALWFRFRLGGSPCSSNGWIQYITMTMTTVLDWLFHQNVFLLRESNSTMSGNGKGFTLEELFRSAFTEL